MGHSGFEVNSQILKKEVKTSRHFFVTLYSDIG